MRSVRAAIFYAIVGPHLLSCAVSPAEEVSELWGDRPSDDLDLGDPEGDGSEDEGGEERDDDDDYDDDGYDDEVDDDDDDDEQDDEDDAPAQMPKDRDAGAEEPAPDAATSEPEPDPQGPDASAPDAAAPKPDAGSPDASSPVVDAATPPSDAGTGSSPANACAPGTYSGPFNGEIAASLLRRSRITATITFTLAASGTTLRIQSGNISGRDASGNAINAQVIGALNCATRRLEFTTLRDGVYSVREGLLDSIRFDGTVTGALGSASPATVTGNWTLRSALGTREGSGTFSATMR